MVGFEQDAEGHRTYDVEYLVECDPTTDGPYTILQTPGLPQQGSPWTLFNEFDEWAWCRADHSIKQHGTQNERTRFYKISFRFSTKPPDPSKQRCQDNPITDPVQEPAKITGAFTKYTKEVAQDRFGRPIITSSWEPIKGPQVEFDDNRATVKINQNVGSFAQVVAAALAMNNVNSVPIWGFPRRTVKLSTINFEKRYQGQCSIYFNRALEFDVSADFDKDIADVGTRVLSGRFDRTVNPPTWTLNTMTPGNRQPNPANPADFITYLGPDGRPSNVLLNGAGIPAGLRLTNQALYYLSITDNVVGGVLTNTANWLPVVGGVSSQPDAWNSFFNYVIGNVVQNEIVVGNVFVPNVYIALANNTNTEPTGIADTAEWKSLSTPPPLASGGVWNNRTTYRIGTYVFNPKALLTVGNIHVEAYNETDFSLLGVPLNFSLP